MTSIRNTIRAAAVALSCAAAAGACSDREPEDTSPESQGFYGLVNTVNEASQAAVDSVLDREVAPRWRFPEKAEKQLAGARRIARGLGAPERLVTVVELEAVRPGGNPSYLRTTAAVFPDGQIKWLTLAAKSGPVTVEPTFAITAGAPELDGGIRAMIDTLASEDCESLPMLSTADVASFPSKVRGKFRDGSSMLPRVCAAMADQSDGWSSRVDDVTVVVADEDRAGVLSTVFEATPAGALKLAVPTLAAP